MLRLRAVLPEDLPAHFAQQADPESTAMAVVGARDRAAFDAHWARLLADPTVVLRTIDVDGAVVGSALSFVRDGRREVGYWVGREHWGRGYASAAVGQLIDLVAERPLFAHVAAHNAGSLHVAEKQGFRRVADRLEGDARICVLRLG